MRFPFPFFTLLLVAFLLPVFSTMVSAEAFTRNQATALNHGKRNIKEFIIKEIPGTKNINNLTGGITGVGCNTKKSEYVIDEILLKNVKP